MVLKEDQWERKSGGGGRTRVFSGGKVFEQGGVNFSHVFGDNLPPSATVNRPELAGRSFQALGNSVVIHPLNPFIPTTHMNIRFFIAEKDLELRGPGEVFGTRQSGENELKLLPFIDKEKLIHLISPFIS